MVAQKIANLYTLRKSKRVLWQIHKLYKRKEKSMDPPSKERIQSYLTSLQTAILQKDAEISSRIAKQCEEAARKFMPKSSFDKMRDFTSAILFALCIAIVIRQMWFEFYTIPTGSMRPTLKENDYLVVSKSDYGLNVPLQTSHFYFDPSLVQRGSIVVFTGANMDIVDADTVYFYLFPGKKQFVKRLIGKPGDILYFYGGRIYGINKQGKELDMLTNPEWFQNLEHIPYIRFEGKVETPNPPKSGVYNPVVFYQMNEPIAKLSVTPIGTVQGEMLPQQGREAVKHYGDLWGMKNYAMSRILTREQAEQIHPKSGADLGTGVLYLELIHHPTLQGAQVIRDEMNRIRPVLSYSTSLIPLQKEHLERIADHMATCRFSVKNGTAYRLGWNARHLSPYLPKLPGVPDGTYEILDGKGYKVLWGGILKELAPNHPLYSRDPERIQLLYNLGIEFLTQYSPSPKSNAHPSRYAYFRNQELYLLGAPIYKKEDPDLVLFLKGEYQKQSMSTSVNPYFPFDDSGPPFTKEGKIDPDFIRKYGLIVPEKMYLVLGDNHAMSSDSRQFGFVPEDNLKGGVSFLFWPPGSRMGQPPQPSHPWLTFPNLIVWGVAIASGLAWSAYQRKKLQQPLRF